MLLNRLSLSAGNGAVVSAENKQIKQTLKNIVGLHRNWLFSLSTLTSLLTTVNKYLFGVNCFVFLYLYALF